MKENLALIKYEKLTTKEKLILYFIVYAFLGWCLETIYAYFVFGHFVKRGFLYGPICPIYGFGAILLLISLENIEKGHNLKKFIISMVVFTIFEYFASFLLEIIFNQRWWDYSNEFMNLQGRVCLTFSIVWGLIGVIFINYIHPFVKKKLDNLSMRIPVKMKKFIIYLAFIVCLVDVVLSIAKHIGIF